MGSNKLDMNNLVDQPIIVIGIVVVSKSRRKKRYLRHLSKYKKKKHILYCNNIVYT